ncbi:gamma-butyrobetaine hydroxylase-related [Holotrichia oblita]|uniref:Gamma-butyrobetaine hydroxylase-related n=1 Tax=Holotrichia oblita TaxID=644536 RepID=A0ACB9T5J9_HOLOL|nr:gamma-butyrobetaine hydroxylase-related [Holotrichia oblita]
MGKRISFASRIFQKVESILKCRAKAMSQKEKQCALLFDEMSLKKGVEYSEKLDLVEGVKDLGFLGRSNIFGTHALVFMLRGIFCKWNIPVCYFISSGVTGTEMKDMLVECIKWLQAIGFDIRTTVCDQRCLSLYENYLELDRVEGDTSAKFHYFWLRDHCRCPKCYNHVTNQINNDVKTIPFNIRPKFCEEVEGKLNITWPDEHKTEYDINLLKKLISTRAKPQNVPVHWDVETLKSITDNSITSKEYFENSDEPTLEATEKVVRHTTRVSKTIFGEMWEVNNNLEVQDTAYTTVGLDAHTDNTYFSEASGLMVFHLIERNCKGGKTLLVDGFNAISNLKRVDRDAFNLLTTNPIESQYIATDTHFTSVEPVIKLHPVTKQLLQIRYNHYDRAYLNTIPFDSIMDYYKAYIKLGEEIKKPSNEYWLQLEPGTVLFLDNWRILHGRGEYSGNRMLTGCYVTRRDWTCAANREGLPLY